MDRYLIVYDDPIGTGSSADVFKATDLQDNRTVAIKRVRIDDQEIPRSAFRECSIMLDCDHRNIVRMERAFAGHGFLYIVMECLSMSLDVHMTWFPEKYPDIARKFLRDLLSGLSFCHAHGIIHRDVKPANLLITPGSKGLKLADFGLARAFIPAGYVLTPEVVTLDYRAPELLLGDTSYTNAIDIWSAGCIFAQMAGMQLLFAGDTEVLLLDDVFSKMGAITEEMWPGVASLPGWIDAFSEYRRGMDLVEQFPQLDPNGVDLLGKLLCLNPKERISAEDALKHAYLQVSGDEDHDW